MNRPYPPRMTVLPSANGLHANPKRGEKSVFCEKRKLSGMPACLAVRIGVGAVASAKSLFRMARAILNSDFADATAPTPILAAGQAGIPESLRFSQKTDFAPRFGFAWRPFADGKTVIRGGFGQFIEGPLGSLISAAWGVHASNVSSFNQSIANGKADERAERP